MLRRIILVLFPLLLVAGNVKLYMKDGEWHLVREYKVMDDRVRFYAVERNDWEEVPVDLVDLKRTEKEISSLAERESKQAKLIDEEEKAERAARAEVARVPVDNGAFYVDGQAIKPLKLAESKLHNNKRRSILAAMSPIPMIAGKATLELDGEKSAFTVTEATPEFYFRISTEQRFGMIKLTPSKGVRIVENISIIPVSKEMIEEAIPVEVFRRQVGDSLYKVWPVEPLEPGEYALVEYGEGKVNMIIYDFAFTRPAK